MKALFIGRFQPFHKGHLKLLQEIAKKYDQIIIGIGSSQYKNTSENPFSFEERKLMIEKSLKERDIKNFKIVAIPDIHNPPKWVDHVTSIVSDFDVVISNNSFTRQLFEKKGHFVEKTGLFNRDKYSGKEIRRKIVENEKWKELVPKSVADTIIKINGIKRINK